MEKRYEEASKVTIQAILWNLFLTVIKIGSGVIGKSTAMVADGIHSASDIITSLGVLVGSKISSKPDDKEHNYGHDKVETLVSFILSVVLIGVSVTIGIEGVKKLFNLESIKVPTMLPLIVSLISILIKEYQYRITIKVANKINSPALKADAWHHRSDALSSIAAFIGIGGTMLGFKPLEPIATVVVAVIVCNVGVEILKISVNELIDVSIDEKEEKEITELAYKTDGVIKVKSIRTRKHGAYAYVDLIVCVDGTLTVAQGHDIATNLENKLIEENKLIKGITVHIEPCSPEINNQENHKYTCDGCKEDK